MERELPCPKCSMRFACGQDLQDHRRHIHDAVMIPIRVPGRGDVCPNCGVVRNADEMNQHFEKCEVDLGCDEDLPPLDDEFDSQEMAKDRESAKGNQDDKKRKREAAAPRQKRAKGNVYDELDAIFSKAHLAARALVGPAADCTDACDRGAALEGMRAELDIANRDREILREALDAERARVRALETREPVPADDLHGLVEARIRDSSRLLSTRAQVGPRLLEDTKLCPPIVILEKAFPGKGLSLLRDQVTSRARRNLQSVVDGKTIDAGIRKAWRDASLTYHPDKRPNLPAEAMSLLNAQYAKLRKIFGSPTTSAASVLEFHDYCRSCLTLLKPGKPWRLLWDHLVPDSNGGGKDCVDKWVGERVSLVKRILEGEIVRDLDKYTNCLAMHSSPVNRATAVPSAPVFPFDQ